MEQQKQNKKIKRYPPKMDIIFQAIFGEVGSENITKDQLLDWLIFLENPESERVTRKMEENENLKEAVEKLDRISEDEKMQRIIELREKAIRDEHAIYAKGVDDGIEKGIMKIAKSMLKKGMNVSDIIEITGLTKEEIEKLI